MPALQNYSKFLVFFVFFYSVKSTGFPRGSVQDFDTTTKYLFSIDFLITFDV